MSHRLMEGERKRIADNAWRNFLIGVYININKK